MNPPITDEQLWSWVDRSAPELDRFLEQNPDQAGRVDELRDVVGQLSIKEEAEPLPVFLGPYQILGRLGAGGMGIVYEGQRRRPRRRAAIKVVRTWLESRDQQRLLMREATALARLSHPNIAALYEAGESEGGLPWFAMELVDGAPIDRWCEAQGAKLEQRIGLIAQVAKALAHAHAAGVIHRDLKPSNVLVNSDGEAKVLDFGLARLVDPGASLSMSLSSPEKILGTIRYMSPEQASGSTEHVGEPSDIYSLGVMLYELVTGVHPHGLEQSTFLEAARTIHERQPKRPRPKGKRLDAGLEAILMVALAREPGRRYESAMGFAADLERFLRGEPVRARRDSVPRRMWLWAKRNRLSAALLLFLLALSVLFTYGGIWEEIARELDNIPGLQWLSLLA